MKVKLTDLLEGVYLQKDWNRVFINTGTGELVAVLKKYLDSDEVPSPESVTDTIEREQIYSALRVRESIDYLPIPVITEDEGKSILVSFVAALIGKNPDPSLSNAGLMEIIAQEGKLNNWYSFHLAQIKNIIYKWAFENKIEVKNL